MPDVSPPRSGAAHLRAAAAALSVCCLLGCATGAKPGAMTPAIGGLFADSPRATVDIEVAGGSETFPLGRSQISDRGFLMATATALEESGLLQAVVDRAGDYHLRVDIEELSQPYLAFPMTVRLVATWRLWSAAESEAIWQSGIVTLYTAPFSREFFGIKRLRLANEGAARRNIREAIVHMAPHLDANGSPDGL